MKIRIKPLLLAGAGLCLIATPAIAGTAAVSAGKLSVQSQQSSLSNVTLTVSGPDGFSASETTIFGSPSVSLSDYDGLADGVYNWQLSGVTTRSVRNPKAGFDNGRAELGPEFINKSYIESGSFRIIGGVPHMPGDQVENDQDGGAK